MKYLHVYLFGWCKLQEAGCLVAVLTTVRAQNIVDGTCLK